MTWKGMAAFVITIVTTLTSAIMTLGYVGLEVHSKQPHVDAVSEREYSRSMEDLKERLSRIESKIDRLHLTTH